MATMITHACRDECEYQIGLVEAVGKRFPKFNPGNGRWIAQAQAIRKMPDLEEYRGEAALQDLSMSLRYAWLRHARGQADRFLKSPTQVQGVNLPSGAQLQYPYDRWSKPESLERRCAEYRPAPAGWAGDHLLFANGMSAIANVILFARMALAGPGSERIRLRGTKGYFEIVRLTEMLSDRGLDCGLFDDQADFHRAVAEDGARILVIEPVAARTDVQVIDLDALEAAWKRRAYRGPALILIDTSLTGTAFPVETITARLDAKEPVIVVFVSSGLKLDQEGLEFSNVGILSVYTPRAMNGGGAAVEIGNKLRAGRATTGTGLGFPDISALEFPTFLDAGAHRRHCDAVFRNNDLAATSIEAGQGIFSEIHHPAVRPGPRPAWAQSPFLNIRMDGAENLEKKLVERVLAEQSRDRGILFFPGTSFGFREHRYEMGIGQPTMRVSMGCRPGRSVEMAIALLNEIGAIPDFDALRARFPDTQRRVEKAARVAAAGG